MFTCIHGTYTYTGEWILMGIQTYKCYIYLQTSKNNNIYEHINSTYVYSDLGSRNDKTKKISQNCFLALKNIQYYTVTLTSHS